MAKWQEKKDFVTVHLNAIHKKVKIIDEIISLVAFHLLLPRPSVGRRTPDCQREINDISATARGAEIERITKRKCSVTLKMTTTIGCGTNPQCLL